ncbi:outer membrane transport energization protein ExbB [Panacagrimonas perspica]|uniref:Biopolymer transport protein ExbB n=1 Tax=Panacagrimonas perspica TaxID=381431 RepID=A0A4S3K4W4_9GAMM|nr:MotA/TolQ/ExbB proton channel family protein [Panacagrimonas perspica]TDU31698.1 outer membrane transport energization protein ExbB [Panacagrimonas perspica]THD03086.1 biopolymer transporter ExbB [Panacagrimonas perspica]
MSPISNRRRSFVAAWVGALLLPFALVAHAQGDAVPAAATELAAPSEAGASIEAPVASTAAENPYGLSAAWNQGDFVSKGAFVILGIMSAATWYLLIVKLFEQHRLLSQARQAERSFWSHPSIAKSAEALPQKSPIAYVAGRGINADRQHQQGALVDQIDRSTWITLSINRAVDEIQSHLQKGLAVLATVGSTAPFVGLFGTVWGIYHALTAIGISGQASIDKVAGPVGEALIMTALGLAVAVPAVLGYNWLVRRNKEALDKVRAFASDLHSVLLSGLRAGERVNDAANQASNPPVDVPVRKAA